MTDNSLSKFGDLTKAATVLIEKISNAVGGVFKPYQIIRVAKAEAEASRIQAESQIQVTDLHRRAMHRFLEEEAQKQLNIEAITQDALPLLAHNAAPQNMADDWMSNFFDKGRIISDRDMQLLWSRILAGEANAPGTFANQTVNRLADLDKSDAELFIRLCGFAWQIGNACPLVFDVQDALYNQDGINFTTLTHLETLGLIKFNSFGGFRRVKLPKVIKVFYYGKQADLTFPADSNNELHLGTVLLTRAGEQLAPFCGSGPVEGFFEFVYDIWASESLVPKRETEQVAPGDVPQAARP